MKKILTGGLLAVAAASMLFAATDKINLYDAEGYLNRSISGGYRKHVVHQLHPE